MTEKAEAENERGQMEQFVRNLLKTMPLSSLTQRIVRDRYKSEFKKDQQLTPKQSDVLRSVVVDVAKAEMNRESKAPKKPAAAPSSEAAPTAQKRPAEAKVEAKVEEKKAKVETVELSDDELEVVSITRADPLPHIRGDCASKPYTFTDNVKIGAYMKNAEYCDKCFCYICDKPAKECQFWARDREPHCNANSKAACWKARRMVHNQVKFVFLNRFITKHIGAPRHAALRAEATIICVEMREAYQLYRMGMKCDAKLVPCNCVCHNRPSNWCGKCRSVHDLKKKFDYRPVRAKVKELIKKIQAWTTTPQEQCFLYEIIMNELTMHKGADINQITQQSGNPDVEAQCNSLDVLKEPYLLQPLSQTLASNTGLWKDLNEALRLVFRSQAVQDQVIKNFFEALQSHLGRARSANQQRITQVTQANAHQHHQVRNVHHNAQQIQFNNIPYGQRGHLINQNGMMIQNQARPPGGNTMPFQRGTSKGSGIREVRSTAPTAATLISTNGTAIQHRGTTLAVATVSTSSAGTVAARATGTQPPAGLFSVASSGKPGTVQIRIPANMTVTSATPATMKTTKVAVSKSQQIIYNGSSPAILQTEPNSIQRLEDLNILNEQQERDLEEKCENRIKVGQFNSTAQEVKKYVENYRYRRLWFIGKGVYRVYLVCLAHTDPMAALKELWNMEKHIKHQFGPRQPPWRLDADDVGRILMIVIQDVPSIKKVVLTKKFHCPPDWPIMGAIATRPYKKLNDLMRGVFIVMISLIRSNTNHSCSGSVDLLMFALRIFCPLWSHNDGDNLADMLKYYKQTKEVNKDLDPANVISLNFDAAMKSSKIREKVDSSTARVFCIAFLLARHVKKWESRHPQEIINLMAHPRTKYHELEMSTPTPIWNFALFALCNQNEVAETMIALDNYGLLNWFLTFLSSPENGKRYNIISNFLNISVVRTIVLKSKMEFSIKFLDVLYNTISDFYINGKLNMEAKRKYYDKYVDISAKFLDRAMNQLDQLSTHTDENFPGLKILKATPDWLFKLDYLEGLSYGLIDLMADRRAQLMKLCLLRKTGFSRYYPNAAPVRVSLELFGDTKHKNNFGARYRFQSRLLGAFVSSSVQSLQETVDPLISYLIKENTREDVPFLKALRMIQCCTKSRFAIRNEYSIDYKPFMAANFTHVCDINKDSSMNLALILQTILMAEDDCIEQLHVSGLEYLSQLLGDCCFSWLDCDKCLINNTKVFDERNRIGIDAFGKMLNRLTKIRHHKGPGPHFHPFETTQAMIYCFMKKLWEFFEPLSQMNYNELSNNNDKKNLFNETCHKYNILGKMIMILHQPVYPALNQAVTKKLREGGHDEIFKGALEQFIFTMQNSTKIKAQPFTNFLRSRAQGKPNIITLQPGIRVVQIKAPILAPATTSTRPARPEPRKKMPKLTRKPTSPANSRVPTPTNSSIVLSDDDYSPESDGVFVDMNNLGERKRTRFECQKERQEAFEKKKEQDRMSSEKWKTKRSELTHAKFGTLEKKGYKLPTSFQFKLMNICSLDPLANRERMLQKQKEKVFKKDEKPPLKLKKEEPTEEAESTQRLVFTPDVPCSSAPKEPSPEAPPKLPVIRINGLNQTATHPSLELTYASPALKLT